MTINADDDETTNREKIIQLIEQLNQIHTIETRSHMFSRQCSQRESPRLLGGLQDPACCRGEGSLVNVIPRHLQEPKSNFGWAESERSYHQLLPAKLIKVDRQSL